ncbi:MAG: YceH family protein [Acidimicrobiales bacterium]
MELTPIEVRVLGVLVEKDRTTPDSYPLTTNSLVNACNQKTSRHPVMTVSSAEVDATMLLLRDAKLARTVRGVSERTYKHRHTFQEALSLDDEQIAVLAVLMLRGAQSPGELRTRTERYISFADLAAVERALGHLASRDEPLVRNVGRASGQSQDRWIHLLLDDDAPIPEPVPAPEPSPGVAPALVVGTDEVAALRAEVVELTRLVERLYGELGIGFDTE